MDPLASPRQAPAAETADRKSERRKWYGKAQTALFMSVIAPFLWAVFPCGGILGIILELYAFARAHEANWHLRRLAARPSMAGGFTLVISIGFALLMILLTAGRLTDMFGRNVRW